MSPIEWYYAHENERAGPVPPVELKQLAAAGELLPDDLVWREGMDEWVAARNVRGLFEGTASEAAAGPPKAAATFADDFQPVSPMPSTAPGLLAEPGETALDRPRRRGALHAFDFLLDAARAQFTAQFVDSTSRIFATCGHYGLYVAMLASLGAALALGIKVGPLNPVLLGVIWLLALAVLQYAARRSCVAMERLNRATSAVLSTAAVPDSLALLNMVAGLAILLGSAVLAVESFLAERSGAFPLVLFGLMAFIVCEYVAFISLNFEALGVSVIPQVRAGEEASGLLSFLLKALLRLSPVAFGAGVVCGTLWLCYAFYQASGDGKLDTAQETAFTATCWIIAFAALPFVAYVCFLLCYLLVEVIRAVLSTPGKLDVLAEGQDGETGEQPAGRRAGDR